LHQKKPFDNHKLSLLLLLVLIAGLAGLKNLLLVHIAGLSSGTAGIFLAHFLFLLLPAFTGTSFSSPGIGNSMEIGTSWFEPVPDLHLYIYGNNRF
jgi:hypothetical protein